jgi:hypothetical protein
MEEDQGVIQQELQRRLGENVSAGELADEIARLLKPLGKNPGTFESVAQYLANKLAPGLTRKSYDLQRLIEYRWNELASLADLAKWDEIETKVLPMIEAQKKGRRKIKTQRERLRRNKRAKNRYERLKRNYVSKPGAIERDFSTPDLFLLNDAPPNGPCLDGIFHGGRVKMCGDDSLQWLFGLRKKRLSMARPALRQGREIFYDYRGVLACMDALLKQTGSNAYWLPDASRRETVLTGVLFRARQKAKPKILKEFEKTLLPHLN